MKNLFGPQNSEEAEVYAVEGLLAETQHCIQSVMNGKKVNRSELARRLGCTPANVSQMLSEYSNLTLESVARIFHVLDDRCVVKSRYLENRQREAVAVNEDHDHLRLHAMAGDMKTFSSCVLKTWPLQKWHPGAVAANEDNYFGSRDWMVDGPYKAWERIAFAGGEGGSYSARVKDKLAGYFGSGASMDEVSAENPELDIVSRDDAEYHDWAA